MIDGCVRCRCSCEGHRADVATPRIESRNEDLSATMETELEAIESKVNSGLRSQGPRWPIRQPKKLEWHVENALGQGISAITAQIQGILEQARIKECLLEDEQDLQTRLHACIFIASNTNRVRWEEKMQCCMSRGIICSDKLTDRQERTEREGNSRRREMGGHGGVSTKIPSTEERGERLCTRWETSRHRVTMLHP